MIHYYLHIRRLLLPMLVLACWLLVSCNDFLDVKSNHTASEDEHWNRMEDVRAALMGVYGLTRAALSENNTHWLCGDLRLGDFTVYDRADLKAIAANDLLGNHKQLDGIANWRRFYAAINAAAILIENVPAVPDRDKSYADEYRRYDIAQAKAIRAFVYFYMVRMYGDVPLITQSFDNGSFPSFARSDAQAVLNFAKNELLTAIPELPYLYGTSTNRYYGNTDSYWRGMLFNKLSAYALLAHIAAWEGNYADAEVFAGYVMNNAGRIGAAYITTSDLTASNNCLFGLPTSALAGARIIAFPSSYTYREATQTGHIEELTLASPFVQKPYPDIYLAKEKVFSIFDDLADNRFGVDTATFVYSTAYFNDMNADYPLFSKIKVIQGGQASDGNYAVFGSSIIFTRLEEIALLRAEALTALNRPSEALTILNDRRAARGLRALSFRNDFGNSERLLLQTIFEERRKELMGEGWYWYDCIRRQKLLNDNPMLGKLIVNGGIYWPIAKDVLSQNDAIEQNKYWK